MSTSPPEDDSNGYTTSDGPFYIFTDRAIIPPEKGKPPAAPEPPEQES